MATKLNARRLLTLAYEPPSVAPKVSPLRRTKPPELPGWRFDLTVVVLTVALAIASLI